MTLGSLVSMGSGGVNIIPFGWVEFSLENLLVLLGKLKSSAMSP